MKNELFYELQKRQNFTAIRKHTQVITRLLQNL